MSTKTQIKPQSNLSLDQVKEKIDEYEGTIHAIQAFVSLTTWDKQTGLMQADTKFSFGRKMETSPKNRVSPNSEVTPDAVIQVRNQLGYSIEVKYSLPKDTEFWSDTANQMLKYDDDMLGWWTPNELISKQCTGLLIEQGRYVRFKEYLESWMVEHHISFGPTVSIIQFSKSDNVKPYYFLRMDWGHILDDILADQLKYGVKVPIIKVVTTYGTKKFYDTEPPAVEFTMATIWQDIFTPAGASGEYNKRLGGIPIYVNLDQLTLELQKLFGQTSNSPRDVKFPRKNWIRKAMDEFVNIGRARQLDDNPEGYDYLVIFRHIKKELLEYFVENRMKSSNKTPRVKQLHLFPPTTE